MAETTSSASTPVPWPRAVRSQDEALKILTGSAAPPAGLEAVTAEFLAALSFGQRAMLNTDSAEPAERSVAKAVGVQWRLTVALSTRPKDASQIDAAALDRLFSDVDSALQAVSSLAETDDPDIQEACKQSRSALARLVQQFLPDPQQSEASPGESSQSGRREVEKALAAAARSVKSLDQGRGPAAAGLRRAKTALAGLVILAVSGALVALVATQVLSPRLPPVPKLPPIPPGVRVMGDPKSGNVFLVSQDGKPLSDEVLSKFTAEAAARGASVTRIAPTQVLVTGSPSR